MNVNIPTLQWSVNEPPTEVRTGPQLDALLDEAAAKVRPDHPIAARLQAHRCCVDILLGLPESFVFVDDVSPPRHYVTVGDLHVGGMTTYYLLGQHHMDIESRHLIPLATARKALREFFDTGRRPASVEWEEGWH